MKSIQQWLTEYGESHQNSTNKLIHWICVPIIFWTITALLWSIQFDLQIWDGIRLNLGIISLLIVWIYYLTLSMKLSIGMLFFTIFCLVLCYYIEFTFGLSNLRIFAIVLFILAWIGQFYGHKIEGKKPSFLKDLQYLMIGPAWLMSFIYKKLNINL